MMIVHSWSFPLIATARKGEFSWKTNLGPTESSIPVKRSPSDLRMLLADMKLFAKNDKDSAVSPLELLCLVGE